MTDRKQKNKFKASVFSATHIDIRFKTKFFDVPRCLNSSGSMTEISC